MKLVTRAPFAALLAALCLTSGPAWTQSISATIPYNCIPNRIAVNEATDKIYVTGEHVVAIDGATNMTTNINNPAAAKPGYLAVNSKTNKIYVVNQTSKNITVIDGATNAVTTLADPKIISSFPERVAVNEATNKIYVTNPGVFHENSPISGSLTIIDGATNQIQNLSNVTSDGQVSLIRVNPVTNKIYVSGISSFSVIDGATNKVTFIPFPETVQFATLLAINPTLNKIYASDNGNAQVLFVIDGDTNAVMEIPFDFNQISSAAVDVATNQVFIDTLSYIVVLDGNTNTVQGAISNFSHAPGYLPFGGIVVNPVTDKGYSGYESAANANGPTGGGVTVIEGLNPQSPFIDIAIPQPSDHVIYPEALAVNTITNKVYVVGDSTISACGNITVLEGAGPVGSDYQLSESNIPFGSRPIGLQGIKHVTVTTGSQPIQFASVAMAGQNPNDFKVQNGNCPATLQPLTTCTYIVTFQPTNIGLRRGLVVFTPVSGTVHTITVSGPGAPAIPAGPLSFDKPVIEWGPVNVGNVSNPIHINISNSGVTASLSSVTLTGRNAGDFRIVSNTCPAKIAPNGVCEVDIVFAPTATGGRITNLTFADNGSNPGQYIPIEGPAR